MNKNTLLTILTIKFNAEPVHPRVLRLARETLAAGLPYVTYIAPIEKA